MALRRDWEVLFGDVSTAFLHALLDEGEDIHVEPPAEYYPNEDPEMKVAWKLLRPLYGLKTAPKKWQDYFAKVLSELGGKRLKSEPNVYYFPQSGNYVLVYVDDLIVLGPESQTLFNKIQERVLLRSTGSLSDGGNYQVLGPQTT